jgi:predicted nuclease with RNAse H fold
LLKEIEHTAVHNKDDLVVGVDVGGRAKGFHAVALKGGHIAGKKRTCAAMEIRDWCLELGASAVGVDAPCRASLNGLGRGAEKALAAERIFSFSTPTRENASKKPFYGWMICGWELFQLLESSYPLISGSSLVSSRASFETFPHAVACALAGSVVSAKNKRTVRREILRRFGIEEALVSNIDEVDAALCAIAAVHLRNGTHRVYGGPLDGFIVVPSAPLSRVNWRCGPVT